MTKEPVKKVKNVDEEKGGKKIKMKVEPKTFFSNERTVLQWNRTGINLFSLGRF